MLTPGVLATKAQEVLHIQKSQKVLEVDLIDLLRVTFLLKFDLGDQVFPKFVTGTIRHLFRPAANFIP